MPISYIGIEVHMMPHVRQMTCQSLAVTLGNGTFALPSCSPGVTKMATVMVAASQVPS